MKGAEDFQSLHKEQPLKWEKWESSPHYAGVTPHYAKYSAVKTKSPPPPSIIMMISKQ